MNCTVGPSGRLLAYTRPSNPSTVDCVDYCVDQILKNIVLVESSTLLCITPKSAACNCPRLLWSQPKKRHWNRDPLILYQRSQDKYHLFLVGFQPDCFKGLPFLTDCDSIIDWTCLLVGCVLITFKSRLSVPPYRIENKTKDVMIYFAQAGVAGDRERWNWLRPTAGGCALPYAWDEPKLSHKMQVQVRLWTSRVSVLQVDFLFHKSSAQNSGLNRQDVLCIICFDFWACRHLIIMIIHKCHSVVMHCTWLHVGDWPVSMLYHTNHDAVHHHEATLWGTQLRSSRKQGECQLYKQLL